MVQIVGTETIRNFSLDEFMPRGEYEQVNIPKTQQTDARQVVFRVVPSGPTKVLRVTDNNTHLYNYIEDSDYLTKKTKSQYRLNLMKENEVSQFELRVELSQIGVSIVDDTPQELMYISLFNVHLDVLATNLNQQLALNVGRFQVYFLSLPHTSLY
jgi:hypothetical protein